MQAVREARSVSHPVWSHYMLLKPNPGVRFTHCKKTQTGLSIRLFRIMKGSIIYFSLSCYVAMWAVLTRPWNWDCLVVVVVLVFLWSSVQLDPRVFPADWLLAVIIVALLLRPLLKTSQDLFISAGWLSSLLILSSCSPLLHPLENISYTE